MNTKSPSRSYRQGARAEAAEATYGRILNAFMVRLGDSWVEEITLENIAADAGVSVQTVIRRFGGKDGLIEAACNRLDADIVKRRETLPGDVDKAIDQLVADYELSGDLVMRLLSQEDRSPAIHAVTGLGRARQRKWVGEVFAPQLSRWAGTAHTVHLDMLIAATDVYVWKLVRRDMGRTSVAYRTILRQMIAGALAP